GAGGRREGGAALATKPFARLVGGTPRRTGRCQGGSALGADLAVRSVLRLTGWTDHSLVTIVHLLSLPRLRGEGRVGVRSTPLSTFLDCAQLRGEVTGRRDIPRA